MTNFKQKIIFDEQQQEQRQAQQLLSQQRFEQQASFTLVAEPDNSDDRQLEQQLTQELTTKKPRWGLRALACASVGLAGWQTIDNLAAAAHSHDWLSLGWSGLVAAVALAGLGALGREWRALKQLKQRQDCKTKLQQMLNENGIGRAKGVCEKLAKQSQMGLSAGFDNWQHALAATHNDKEVFELYDSLVLSQQDKQAKKLVSQYSVEAGVMVALSPLALADMLLVAWRNIHLLEQLANTYGIRLSYWSRIRLLRLVLSNMALAGASELVASTSMDLLSVSVAGKLSSRAAQGLGVGLLTARLGFRAIALMRPLPHLSTPAAKLTDVRDSLLERLSS